MRINLSDLMKLAWRFVKCNGFTMAEGMKQAWMQFKLHAKMLKGIAKFYYLKVSTGEVREAYGTLRNTPETLGTGRPANPMNQTYFDTEVQAWRQYRMANLIRLA